MFAPSASALPNAELNELYSEQVINFTVPATTTISGEFVAQAIAIVFPAAAPAAGLLGLESQTFDFNVTRTTLVMNGLPNGMSGNCDATPCTYITGSNGYITVEGTPTEPGNFEIDIITLTEGEADISSLGGGFLDLFGIPSSFALPTPVPSDLDELGYTLQVNNTSSVTELNDQYQLQTFPNPTTNIATVSFECESPEPVQLNLYTIDGSLLQSKTVNALKGSNQVDFDLSEFSAGTYLLKVQLNVGDGLIRIEKR